VSTSAPATTDAATTSAAPVQATVPDVTGQNLRIAMDKLEQAGFTNVTPASVDPEASLVVNAANWTVKSQEPAAGTKALTSDTIVLNAVKTKNA
jgi:beta-lactam-binding protein with PASTA domain